MLENRPEPTQTDQPALSAVRIALGRLPAAVLAADKHELCMRLILEKTEAALARGDAPPLVGTDAMRLYADGFLGAQPDLPISRWLRPDAFTTWAKKFLASIRQALRDAGIPGALELHKPPNAGGRGRCSQYQVKFWPADPAADSGSTAEAEPPRPAGQVISYHMEPATPALIIRGWWFLPDGFSVRSWRGLVFVLILAVAAVSSFFVSWQVILWLIAAPHWMPRHLVALIGLGALLWFVWWGVRAIVLLPFRRLMLAPDWMLGFNQFFGQLWLERGGASRVRPHGWLSLVRFWAPCSICSGEVDLADGGRAFPDRIIGRCADSPAEHVFSFDPVTGAGRLLREGSAAQQETR